MNGYEASKRIKQIMDTWIFAVTANENAAKNPLFADSGIEKVFLKPFTAEQLLSIF